MIFFLIFISVVIIQRLSELILSSNNENFLKSEGAIEYDKEGYKYIVALHVLFILSIFIEYFLLERKLNNFWIILIIIFLWTQLLRYWAMWSLGNRWCTKILVLQNSELIKSGPYKYLSHPNYLAVILEIAVIPLMFSCYYTALIFSMLNLLVLRRRIKFEERALNLT